MADPALYSRSWDLGWLLGTGKGYRPLSVAPDAHVGRRAHEVSFLDIARHGGGESGGGAGVHTHKFLWLHHTIRGSRTRVALGYGNPSSAVWMSV